MALNISTKNIFRLKKQNTILIMLLYFFYIIVGLLGVITCLILYINYKSNRSVNLYFLVFLILFSLKFILDGLFYFFDELRPDFHYKTFFIVATPTIYLYLQNLIFDTKKHNLKELKHFILPTVFFCFSILNNYFKILDKNFIYYIYFSFCIYNLIYLFLSIFLLKKTIWNVKMNRSIVFNQNIKTIKWINFLFVLFIFIILRLLSTTLLDLFNVDFSFGENYSWILGCLFITILIRIWTSPDLLFGYNALYNNIKDENFTKLTLNDIWILTLNNEMNNIQDNELKNKVYVNLNKQISRIEKIALKEKWFRNNNTSKPELAEKLNIPKSHINFIFKYHSKISYADFVNRVRTYDAISLIESGYLLNHKLDALALKVGYLSYNPFFSAFKEITGTSPRDYNKEKINLKKYRPNRS